MKVVIVGGVQPQSIDGLTVTFDMWEIEKENTIGLFGRNNQGVADLLARLRSADGCTGIPQVIRDDTSDIDDEEAQYFAPLPLPVPRHIPEP